MDRNQGLVHAGQVVYSWTTALVLIIISILQISAPRTCASALHFKIVLGSQIVLAVPTHPVFASPAPVTPLSVSFIYSNTTLCIWRTSALLMVRTRTVKTEMCSGAARGEGVQLLFSCKPDLGWICFWSGLTQKLRMSLETGFCRFQVTC